MFNSLKKWAATLLGVVTLASATVSPASAQIQPRHTDPTWQGWYWNNTTFSGEPVLSREERALNFDWGRGSPDPRINVDQFAARWTRYIDVTPGTYRFTATSDDGLRLWVDGELVIDLWSDHSVQTKSGQKYLASGHHWVQVDYYDNQDVAIAKVEWMPADAPPPPTPTPIPPTPVPSQGWRGEYFNNKLLNGTPALTRTDPQINFVWGNGSPDPSLVAADYFSARWSQSVPISPGNYRFYLQVDDGARLFVNGHTLIDGWRDQALQTYTGDIYLSGGAIFMQVEYYDNTGAATVQLWWEQLGQQPPPGATPTPRPTPPPPPPSGNAVVVDNGDTGFARGGDPKGWVYQNEGYNSNLVWTQNNDTARYNYNWGRWYPNLRPGRYEVFVYIPDRFSTTSRALYWVSHASGFTSYRLDQSAYSNQWVSIGTYNFVGNNKDYVSLSDVTGETYLSRLIVWDAVKWEPRR